MKKGILVFAMALFAVVSVNAQRTGTRTVQQQKSSSGAYVGGGINFQSTSDNTAVVIEPEVGYQMSDKWGIGAAIGYSSNGSGDSKTSVFYIKPYLRQDLYSIGKVGLFLDYALVYQNSGPKDYKTNTFQLGIEPGLSYQINSKLTMVTHLGFLGYQSQKLDKEGAEAVNTFIVKASSIDLGLSLYYNF